jgi:hypothetical protein
VRYPEIEAPAGIVTVPINVGLAIGEYAWALTKAVVAIEVSLSEVAGVGAFGSPVKVGLAIVEYPWALTKAVEAATVVFDDVAGVGTVTVPEKVGEALGAYEDIPLIGW